MARALVGRPGPRGRRKRLMGGPGVRLLLCVSRGPRGPPYIYVYIYIYRYMYIYIYIYIYIEYIYIYIYIYKSREPGFPFSGPLKWCLHPMCYISHPVVCVGVSHSFSLSPSPSFSLSLSVSLSLSQTDHSGSLRFRAGFGPTAGPKQAHNARHGAHRPAHDDSHRFWPDSGGVVRRRSGTFKQ